MEPLDPTAKACVTVVAVVGFAVLFLVDWRIGWAVLCIFWAKMIFEVDQDG